MAATDAGSTRVAGKFVERRAQLANSALVTLAELGYARTSLREIAQNSDFSHGVLHYYFRDKVDLITHCVWTYKAECITSYDQIVAASSTGEQLRAAFAAQISDTIRDGATVHRLWYDLRTQSMFDASFRADVMEIDRSLQHMVWRVVRRYAELVSGTAAVSESTAYGLFDGLFEQGVLHHIAGDPTACERIGESVYDLLPRLVQPHPADSPGRLDSLDSQSVLGARRPRDAG